MFKRIIALLLAVILILFFSACKDTTDSNDAHNTESSGASEVSDKTDVILENAIAKKEENVITGQTSSENKDEEDKNQSETNNNIPSIETNGENPPQKKDTYREVIKSYLTIPEGYVVPEYNGKLVAGETPDPMTLSSSSPAYGTGTIFVGGRTKALKNKMDEYEGQDVWFRVLVDIGISYGLIKDDHPDSTSAYFKFVREETISFLNAIGAHDLKTEVNLADGNNWQELEVSLTAEMIEMLSGKCYDFLLGQYPKNPEHSKIISETLSIRLDKMTDTDCVEVIAVCVTDEYNEYAAHQFRLRGVDINGKYNYDLFKPFEETDMTYWEYNKMIDEYLSDIAKRNDITEKIIVSDELPPIKFKGTETDLSRGVIGDMIESLVVGFNAKLTKAEILKLAEDEEIKVIYAAVPNKD